MNPIHILVECPELLPSVRVGVLAVLNPLEARELCKVRFCATKEMKKEDVAWCDVFICVRGCEYPTYCIVDAAKKAGKFLVYFLDDDLLHVPLGNSSSAYCYDQGIQMNLPRIISTCDVLWTVNERVAKEYEKYCKRTVVSRVPAKPVCAPTEKNEPLRVVYAGSVDHSGLAKEQLVPAVKRLLLDFPGQIEFVFIGVNPELEYLPGVTQLSFFTDYDQYQRTMKEGGFSLGLAPAYRTPFYACKYYNKFVEYASYGIAGIYTDCEPYTKIVKDGENGFLCREAPEDWYDVIRGILEGRVALPVMSRRIQAQLVLEFDEENIAQKLWENIPEFLNYHAPWIERHKIKLLPMWWLFYWERVLLMFRIYGWRGIWMIPFKVCKVIWKKMRVR